MSSHYEPITVTPQKIDPTWKHVQLFKNLERTILKCIYCGKVFKGGGIHRFKEHLAGQKGNSSACPRVTSGIRAIMLDNLSKAVSRKTKKQKNLQEEVVGAFKLPIKDKDVYGNNLCEIDVDQQVSEDHNLVEMDNVVLVVDPETRTSSKFGEKRKRGRPKKVVSPLNQGFAMAVSSYANVVDLVESRNGNNELRMVVGRFFYDVGLPLDDVDSVYFQKMMDAIAISRTRVVWLTSNELRGCILRDSVEEVKNNVDQ